MCALSFEWEICATAHGRRGQLRHTIYAKVVIPLATGPKTASTYRQGGKQATAATLSLMALPINMIKIVLIYSFKFKIINLAAGSLWHGEGAWCWVRGRGGGGGGLVCGFACLPN